MNHTSATHTGLLVTGTGDDLEVDLEIIGGRTLRMSASGDELGAWPVDECHIEPDPSNPGSFRLVVDGEAAGFTPADPDRFQTMVQGVMTSTDEDSATDHLEDESAVGAAEDPVAFLFGSTTPPTPATTEMPDLDAVGTDQEWSESPDIGRSEDETEAVEQVEAIDEVETVTAGAAWESVAEVEPAEESEETPTDLVVGEPSSEKPVDPSPTGEDESPDWIELEDGVDPDGEQIGQPAGGGSALSRLSAAIGSLRSSDDEPEVADDDGEYRIGPNTVASEVLATQRSLREHQLKEITKGKWLKWGGTAVATAAVIALFAFLTPGAVDFLQSYESDIAPPPEVSNTTIPSTTSPTPAEDTPPVDTTPEVVAVAGDGGTIFDRPSPEFITSWDAAGATIDEVLTFDGFPQLGPFEEQFTPYLKMNGVVQPDGTLDGFALLIDPTGPAEYDRIGIQALGVAIATVDPERSPEGRASLLGQLGLNVRQPQLEGIDGAAEVSGIAYTLVYDAAANLLTLTVAPAG